MPKPIHHKALISYILRVSDPNRTSDTETWIDRLRDRNASPKRIDAVNEIMELPQPSFGSFNYKNEFETEHSVGPCRTLIYQTCPPQLSSLTPTHTCSQAIECYDSETSSFNELATMTCPCFEGGGGGSKQSGASHNNNNKENDEMDVYYQNAIKDNRESSLILGNYARFLKEVKGDAERAAEYCERAILAKSDDGYMLAMYGELIWEMQRDGFKAKTYFDRALKSTPENCYVLASYARFLWIAEDHDDEDDEDSDNGVSERYNGTKLDLAKQPVTEVPNSIRHV